MLEEPKGKILNSAFGFVRKLLEGDASMPKVLKREIYTVIPQIDGNLSIDRLESSRVSEKSWYENTIPVIINIDGPTMSEAAPVWFDPY